MGRNAFLIQRTETILADGNNASRDVCFPCLSLWEIKTVAALISSLNFIRPPLIILCSPFVAYKAITSGPSSIMPKSTFLRNIDLGIHRHFLPGYDHCPQASIYFFKKMMGIFYQVHTHLTKRTGWGRLGTNLDEKSYFSRSVYPTIMLAGVRSELKHQG